MSYNDFVKAVLVDDYIPDMFTEEDISRITDIAEALTGGDMTREAAVMAIETYTDYNEDSWKHGSVALEGNIATVYYKGKNVLELSCNDGVLEVRDGNPVFLELFADEICNEITKG